jgi:hypothetical protein
MASDRLDQVGKYLGENKRDIDYAERRYAENFPLVERLRDSLDATHPFVVEFLTTHENNNVMITITFIEAFQVTC